MQDLLEQILQHEEAIVTSCDICAELDCLLSFADASRLYDYHRPELSEDNITVIKQGRCGAAMFFIIISKPNCRNRHPLQELVVDIFVPNDALLIGFDCPENVASLLEEEYELDDCMRGCRSNVMVCTGANACGKVCASANPSRFMMNHDHLVECLSQAGIRFITAYSLRLILIL